MKNPVDDMPLMTKEEQILARKYLAHSHEDGECRIYGDDGELQCNHIARHGRCIDFMREPFSDLITIVKETRINELRERLLQSAEDKCPKCGADARIMYLLSDPPIPMHSCKVCGYEFRALARSAGKGSISGSN